MMTTTTLVDPRSTDYDRTRALKPVNRIPGPRSDADARLSALEVKGCTLGLTEINGD